MNDERPSGPAEFPAADRPAEVRDALAATRADLAALRDPALPPAVAARWDAALAAEAAAAPSGRVRPVRRRPASGRGAVPRWLVAAAAVVGAVALVWGALGPRATPPAPTAPGVELVALGRAAVGTMDVGGLADADRRRACLRAVAPAAVGEQLLGGRRVVLDGRPGVLLVLATGTRGGLRIVAVDPDCGPAGGTLLAQLEVR